jgi:hypothetical protein
VVDNIFPEEIFDRLVEALPAPVFFEKTDDLRDEMPVPFLMAPAYSRATSSRHQASLVRATDGSLASSTVSSTSRQNAYSAVIARRWAAGRNRKL